tara:strand:- start:193 stop:378 length:186 start_codon:yes stop_codon:yes gene_type:complete
MEIFEWVSINWDEMLIAMTSIVGGFSVIATMTPNNTDNMIVNKMMKVINFMGANFGKAKNA